MIIKFLIMHLSNYFHSDPQSNIRVKPKNSYRLTEQQRNVSHNSALCPSKFQNTGGGTGSGTDLPSDYEFGLTSADNGESTGESLLVQLIDEGSTPQLEAQILAAGQPEHQQLYIDMMDMSPYVSQENLLNLIEVDNFPELALRNVFLANPDAAANPDIWSALENRQPALSQQTLTDIESGTATITSRDVLEGEMNLHRQHKVQALERLLEHYGNDTSGIKNEAYIDSLLNARDEDIYRYSLVELQLKQESPATAQSTINNLTAFEAMGEQQQLQYAAMKDYYDILIAAAQANRGVAELTEQELDDLEDVEELGTDLAKAKARGLLRMNGREVNHIEPTYLPPTQSNKNATAISRPSKIERNISISPNPATKHLILTWDWLEEGFQKPLKAEVRSADGKKVIAVDIEDFRKNTLVVSLKGQSSGLYLFSLLEDDKTIWNQKLIIVD